MAKHFRVTPTAISILFKKIKSKPALLTELLDKKKQKLQTRDVIKEHLQTLVDQGSIIDSAASVRNQL